MLKGGYSFKAWCWNLLRKRIRDLGEESNWYRILEAYLRLFTERNSRAQWVLDQMHLERSSSWGLDLWGVRYKLPRENGEPDELYRQRLIIERTFRYDSASIQTKRRKLIQYLGGINFEELTIRNVYGSPESLENFTVGGPIGSPQFSRSYITHRYWIEHPELPEEADRAKIDELLGDLNVGGNVPEFHEDRGTIDWFGIGTPIDSPIQLRRVKAERAILTY